MAINSPLNAASEIVSECPAFVPCCLTSEARISGVLGCLGVSNQVRASSCVMLETSWSQLARWVPAPFERRPEKLFGVVMLQVAGIRLLGSGA